MVKYLILGTFFLSFLGPSVLHARWDCSFPKKDINTSKCIGKKVHLTFDDGPHPTYTPKVLESLKNPHRIPATFFVTTANLDKSNNQKKMELVRKIQDSQEHILATHGHEHIAHDTRIISGKHKESFDASESLADIQASTAWLDRATGGAFSKKDNRLIRFPYARGITPSPIELNEIKIREKMSREAGRNDYILHHSAAMRNAASEGYSHVGWNHDSEDSTGKYNKTNQDVYVDNFLKNLCNSGHRHIISLLHDIQKVNVLPSKENSNKTVLDEVIMKAKCLGVDFVGIREILNKDLPLNVYTDIGKVVADETQDALAALIDTLPNSGEAPVKVCPCEVEISPQSGGCVSSYNGAYYENCKGSASICYQGKWYAKTSLENPIKLDDIRVANACGFKQSRTCYSSSAKKDYGQCEGESSVCFDGRWYSRQGLSRAKDMDELVIASACGIRQVR